ncbi:MAG: peptidylprolyl isomerase [Candidatus Altimarinota bacterium]
MKKRVWKNILFIIIFSGFLVLVDNPWKLPKLETDIPVITPVWNWIQDSTVSLGLDLQGGTQLDYEIDLSDARARNSDEDPENDINIPDLLAGVKDVIEKRVNSLGVAEPNIYLSSAGEEEHIVVELPGVKDIDEAKEKVGKVVQLEFKTEKSEPSEEDIAAISKQADEFLQQVLAESSIEDLEAYVEDIAVSNQVEYRKEEASFADELPQEFQDIVKTMEPNTFYREAIKAKEATYIVNNGQLQQPEGFNIVRLIERSEELRKKPVNAEDFTAVMEDVGGTKQEDYLHTDDIQPPALATEVSALEVGEITGVVETSSGFYIAKMENKLAADESENASEQIRTAHILLKTQPLETLQQEKALKEIPDSASEEEKSQIEQENQAIEQENATIRQANEAVQARNETIEAQNAEVKAKAEDILAQVKANPEQFGELAKQYSEDSSAEKGGDLGYSVPTAYVEPYRDAALALEEGAFTQELVESQFGYHIIRLIDTKAADEELYQFSTIRVCYEGAEGCESTVSKEDAKAQADEALKRVRQEPTYTLERIWFNAVPDPWEKTELDGRYFKRADVMYDQITYRPYVSVTFNDEGAKLFEQLTEQNIQKRLGIFVGGEFISAPVVQEKIAGGTAQITMGTPQIDLALSEANELARSLNAGSIPAPLKKPNELNIGASLGNDALQKSLYAGLIGVILVAVFMILYYRFLGVLAAVALVIYGLFLLFVIQSQVPPVLALVVSLVFWIAFVFRLFKTRIDGLGKALFLLMSIFGVLFIFTVLTSPIVLTLAGVAGILLSIGMAVDANILIFERIREEFDQGKNYLAAINDGFDRAWSSILDSNVSSLITCAILFSFGTSIIKGFAINLAIGIVLSMFTAITVTKIFMLAFSGTALEKINWLWMKKK